MRSCAVALALVIGCGKGGDAPPPTSGGPAPAPVAVALDAAPVVAVVDAAAPPPADPVAAAFDEANQLTGVGDVAQPTDRRRGDGMVSIGPRVPGPKDTTPPGRTSLIGKTAHDDTTLTADKVARKVNSAYTAGLRRCYQEVLRTDPTLVANLTIQLTVSGAGGTGAGRATKVAVTAPTPGFSACVKRLVENWRFEVPKDEDGEPTDASFELRFRLVPS